MARLCDSMYEYDEQFSNDEDDSLATTNQLNSALQPAMDGQNSNRIQERKERKKEKNEEASTAIIHKRQL